MRSVFQELESRVSAAMTKCGHEGDPILRASQDPKFGDYQSNAAMGLAKKAGKKPRDVATEIVAALEIDDLCEPPEIAGPGFINLRIRPEFVASELASVPAEDDRLGIPKSPQPQVVVVDLSSPNLAKEMHVGHLRSTVIGDAVSRVLEFAGHEVHRENHVGDWGTQFGMLVAFLLEEKPGVENNPDDLVIADLEVFYIDAKQRFDTDKEFKERARETVVKLQQGDESTRRIWKAFCKESLRHCHEILDLLNVRVEDRGESYYTELMGEVIRRVEKIGETNPDLVRVSDGALCAFMDGFITRDGDPLPMIVRKRDGGYNYATSDLATIVDRVERLKAERIIYVVGLPQKQHFEMVFAGSKALGLAHESVEMIHLAFGSVLSKSGQPFKTREGGTFKLKTLLEEAITRARTAVDEGQSESDRPLSEEEKQTIARRVGLASVKYFDLSHSLQSDYKFDLDHMLSLEGNTAPYMLYAYARIASIVRKAGDDAATSARAAHITLQHESEIALAKKIAQFIDVQQAVERDLKPNLLTDYLYDLAKSFSRFYDKKQGVRVLDAETDALRLSRLRLCDLTARTLKLGLSLLGIETVEQM